MKHETISLHGEVLDIYYKIEKGMLSTNKDVPNNEDELEIISIKKNGYDISDELFFQDIEEVKRLLVEKIKN